MTAIKSSIPRIAFVGVPNVGKSSLINRLLGHRQAIVHESAHTTRDTASHRLELDAGQVDIQDTPGFALKGQDELLPAAMAQLDQAIDSADGIVMVVNSTASLSPDERALAKRLLRLKKPVLVAASQIDKAEAKPETYLRLGLGQPLAVSGHHNLGIDELRDWLVKQTGKRPQSGIKPGLTVAIIGHPNAGKSSLLNALTGEATAVISPIPGTTRDPIESQIQFGSDAWRLTDTAGVRRPGKIGRGIEYFSLTRTEQVIAQSDVVLLVVDATNPGNAQDQRLAGLVQEAGRGLIVVMNKIDLLAEGQLQFAMQDLTKSLDFMRWAIILPVSATSHDGIPGLLKTIRELGSRIHTRIATKDINDALQDMISSRPPTSGTRFRPKLNYAVQTASLPLTISIHGAHPEAVHFSYRRYLENEFRKRWPLTGIPLKIEIRSKYKD